MRMKKIYHASKKTFTLEVKTVKGNKLYEHKF